MVQKSQKTCWKIDQHEFEQLTTKSVKIVCKISAKNVLAPKISPCDESAKFLATLKLKIITYLWNIYKCYQFLFERSRCYSNTRLVARTVQNVQTVHSVQFRGRVGAAKAQAQSLHQA